MRALIALILIFTKSIVVLGYDYIESRQDTSKGELYFNIAEKYYSNSKYDSSSYYYKKSADSYLHDLKYKKYLISLNYAALDFVYLAKYELGLKLLKNGLVTAIENFGVYDSLTAVLFNTLGSAYYSQGDYENAQKIYNLSLNIKLKIFGTNHNETAFGYHNTGLGWYFMGNYEKALEYFNRALATWLPIYEKATSTIGNCYINIANVYAALGEYDKSIEYDKKALETWKLVLGEEHRYIAMSYNNLAESYDQIKKYEEALQYANKSLKLNEKLYGSNHPQEALNKSLIARIYKNQGNLVLAKKYLDDAINIWKKHPLNKKRIETLFQLADWNIKSHNYSDALEDYDSILTITLPEALDPEFNSEKSQKLAVSNFSNLYAVAGKGDVYFARYRKNRKNIKDLDSAKYWYENYSKIVDQLGKTFRRENSKLGLSKTIHNNNYKLIEIYYQLYKLTFDRSYINLAYSISTNSKATILNDAIAESGAKKFSGIPDSLILYEKTLQKELEFNYDKLGNAEEEKAPVSEITEFRKQIFDISSNYDKLIKEFENKYLVYYDLKYGHSHNSAIKKIDSVDTSAAIIEYFVADTTIFVFAIVDEKITIEKHTVDNLVQTIKLFRNSLQNLEFEEYLNSAYYLYQLLIEPVSDGILKKSKLYIIPDGVLNYLPFEALISEKINPSDLIGFDEPEYLIKKWEISYHYSIDLLNISNIPTQVLNYSYSGIAPVFSESPSTKINNLIDTSLISSNNTRSIKIRNKTYSSLPYSEKEVIQIAKLFEENNLVSKSYIRSQAREELIKSQEIQNYSIIHIASHGFINEKRPRLSGILFWENDSLDTEDAVLHLGEIFNLDLKSDLIVLSACESGLGKLVKGEGIIGLSRGFIYSGAKNLILSLWQVADKSTAELMLNFYNYLLEGNTYSKSLRFAKLKLINEKKYSYPLEWSPFILIGH